MAQLGWSAKADVDPRPAPIDWGSAPVERVEPAGPPLRIGAYVTNISDIDLLQDQFSVEMLLWTTWAGDPQADPSDQLMTLNGIYDGDIQRFERVSHEQIAAGAWNLYRVRSAVSQAKGLGALVTSFLTLVLLALGALLIQPRLTERRQLLPDRYVLTADEVAALPQGTLPVVLDRLLGQDPNDFRFRLLKLVLERSGTPFPGFQRCRSAAG